MATASQGVHEFVYRQDNEGNVSASETYMISGASGATAATILATSGIPATNDVLAGSGGAIAREIEIRQEGPTNTTAKVTVSYSTKASSGTSNPDDDRDPTTDPPQLSMQPANASVQAMYDFSTPKKAYRNSAGQMLDPVPERDDPRVVFIYEKNVNDISAAAAQNLSHGGATNQSAFTLSSDLFSVSIGAKKCIFLGHACSPAGYYTDSLGEKHAYWRRRSEFLVRKADWNPTKRADYGTAELIVDLDNGGLKAAQIVGPNGIPVSDPVPLNGSGNQVDLTDPNAKPAELIFKDYEELDFGGLV